MIFMHNNLLGIEQSILSWWLHQFEQFVKALHLTLFFLTLYVFGITFYIFLFVCHLTIVLDMDVFHYFCFLTLMLALLELPRWLSGNESACQCRRCRKCGFDPWVGEISWRRKWRPTLVSCLEDSMHRGVWWAAVQGSQGVRWLRACLLALQVTEPLPLCLPLLVRFFFLL